MSLYNIVINRKVYILLSFTEDKSIDQYYYISCKEESLKMVALKLKINSMTTNSSVLVKKKLFAASVAL